MNRHMSDFACGEATGQQGTNESVPSRVRVFDRRQGRENATVLPQTSLRRTALYGRKPRGFNANVQGQQND